MSELGVEADERRGAYPIERYAAVIEDTASDWAAIKRRRAIAHDIPGSKRAYEETGYALLGIAMSEGLPDAERGPFISGTSVIMRFQHILALKSREMSLDFERASRLLHNHRTYTNLSRIAGQHNDIANVVERGAALIGGVNPEEPMFWQRFVTGVDSNGEPMVSINGLGAELRMLQQDEDLAYDIETNMILRKKKRAGCDALYAHQLERIYQALADIVTVDPDLLLATLRSGDDSNSTSVVLE